MQPDAGHMISADGGDSWMLADGTPLTLPVIPAANDAFFKQPARKLRGMALDSQDLPWIVLSEGEIWHYDGQQWSWFSPEERLVGGSVALDEAKDFLTILAKVANNATAPVLPLVENSEPVPRSGRLVRIIYDFLKIIGNVPKVADNPGR